MKYAVVDIETTGGSAKLHGITEIAIIELDDGVVIDRYSTLVNPGMYIPTRITDITGITNEMVEGAPAFHEVAGEIWKRTHDRVFVAHNVNFDYGFIREQYARLGAHWRPKRLCTVRLSRKLIPDLYSYSLGEIAKQLGYVIEDRHRAMGDCVFTVQLFQKLLELDKGGQINFALNARSREATMPPLLNREKFDKLPSMVGVYILKGSKGRVLYVGKANDLKKRVSEHFRGSTHTGLKNRFAEKIEDVDWIVCPNELIALLTEAAKIKQYWPPYNSSMKRVSLNYGIYTYTDQSGYRRFTMGRVGKWDKPVYSFRNRFEAQVKLEYLCMKHELCERLCGLQEIGDRCFNTNGKTCCEACIGKEAPESYNHRCQAALDELCHVEKTMLITGEGFTEHEVSVVLLEAGRYKGHGLVPQSVDLKVLHEVKEFLETGYDDQDMQVVIMRHLSQDKHKHKIIVL